MLWTIEVMELFDVVNEQDEVIAQASREEVHAQRLMHRAVHMLVFNAVGELFFQRRSLNKDTYPGFWSTSAAGHVDTGETYAIAAAREFREELGVVAPELFPLFKIAACKETGNEFVWVYRCIHEGPFQLNADEVMDGEWLSISVLKEKLISDPKRFTPSTHCVMRHYFGMHL
jgi:isopentenyl-diphosphate delta-isomerase type 1